MVDVRFAVLVTVILSDPVLLKAALEQFGTQYYGSVPVTYDHRGYAHPAAHITGLATFDNSDFKFSDNLKNIARHTLLNHIKCNELLGRQNNAYVELGIYSTPNNVAFYCLVVLYNYISTPAV